MKSEQASDRSRGKRYILTPQNLYFRKWFPMLYEMIVIAIFLNLNFF